jgi:hypothetical protein
VPGTVYPSGCGARQRLEQGEFKPAICETLSAALGRAWNIHDVTRSRRTARPVFSPALSSGDKGLPDPSFIFYMNIFAQVT